MESYSAHEVIEQAIQTERMGFNLYTKMAEKFVDNAQLNELFKKLAAKELDHEKIFINLRKDVGHQLPGNWGEISMYMRAISESAFFLGKNKPLPSLEHINTAEDAVRYAMRFEKDTLLYFHSMEELGEGTDVIDIIINEERKHIVWLGEFRKTLHTDS